MLHDDRPQGWQPTSPSALLIHGLAGCHASIYVANAARRLFEAGVRTFRMDMRGCGACEGLARLPYHAGCSEDLLAALNRVAAICPVSPISLVGFSIGGNAALKLAGELPEELPAQLDRLVVVSPPIDLHVCIERFANVAGGLYDRHFAKSHHRQLNRSAALTEHSPHVVGASRRRGQREFDEWYTAPAWGYESVDQFYADTSSLRAIANIRIPTLLIASRDDPLVPVELFEPLEPLDLIKQYLTNHGGHLGFIGCSGSDLDHRWLDWRIVDYITAGREATLARAA